MKTAHAATRRKYDFMNKIAKVKFRIEAIDIPTSRATRLPAYSPALHTVNSINILVAV